MARIFIVWSSREGQTRRIVQAVEEQIREAGHEVETLNADDPPRGWIFSGADAVLVAASIHTGRYSERLHQFLKEQGGRMAALPSAFLSVCLSAADPARQADAAGYIDKLITETGWTPTVSASVAGALRYPEYSFLKRWMMKKIAGQGGLPTDTSRVHEFTDWAQVRAFTARLIQLVPVSPQHV